MRQRASARHIGVLILGAIFVVLSGFVPAKAQGVEVEESLEYIIARQDKTTGGIKEDGQDTVSVITSSWSAIAIASAGFDPFTVGEPSLGNYIESTACQFTNVTDIERTILVIAAADKNPRGFGGCDLAEKLEGNIHPDTGIIGNDIISTIFGVLALSSYNAVILDNTIAYIISQQKADGGWDTGWDTEANITAQAIMALEAASYDKESTVIINAKQYLKNLQTDTGGIKYDASAWTSAPDAFSDAYTLQAIYALDENPTDAFWQANGHTILDDLASLRQPNGSYNFSTVWGAMNPVWTTAVVIPALVGKPLGWHGENLISYDTTEFITPAPSAEPVITTATEAPPIAQELAIQVTNKGSSRLNNNSITPTSDSLKTLAADIPPPAIDETEIPNNVNGEVLGAVSETADAPRMSSKILVLAILAIGGLLLGAGLSAAWRKYAKVLALILLLPAVLLPSSAQAARAGLVIRHGSGVTTRSCVSFSEPSITGLELLKRAQMNPILDNGFVVSIDGERAKSFNDAGAQDDYWSYWYVNASKWQYSPLGATYKQVHDGKLNGWKRGGSALLLVPATFEQICPPLESATVSVAPPPASAISQSNTNPSTPAKDAKNKTPTASTAPQPSVTSDNPAIQETETTQPLVAGAESTTRDTSNTAIVLVVVISIITGFSAHRFIRLP